MTKEEIESKAYQEGHKAWEEYTELNYRVNLEDTTPDIPFPSKNPYHEDTPEHRIWRLGWNNNFNGV